MNHGWPQSFAVSIMRHVRRDLEREHARILRQDPGKLLDWKAIRAKAQEGEIAADNPVYLAVASKAQQSPDEAQRALLSAVRRGYQKVFKLRNDLGASSVTMFEVVTLAHSIIGVAIAIYWRKTPRQSWRDYPVERNMSDAISREPHHAHKDRVGTWDIPRLTIGHVPTWPASGR
jgi:hypothetical protein